MKVLVATDGSEFSYQSIREFIRITHATRHDIKIIFVMPSLTVGRVPEYLLIEHEREGVAALHTAKSLFDDVAVPVETEMLQGRPVDAILSIAREGEYDLIVIGRKGRGRFRQLILGSVSQAIVSNAPCSVLVGR